MAWPRMRHAPRAHLRRVEELRNLDVALIAGPCRVRVEQVRRRVVVPKQQVGEAVAAPRDLLEHCRVLHTGSCPANQMASSSSWLYQPTTVVLALILVRTHIWT